MTIAVFISISLKLRNTFRFEHGFAPWVSRQSECGVRLELWKRIPRVWMREGSSWRWNRSLRPRQLGLLGAVVFWGGGVAIITEVTESRRRQETKIVPRKTKAFTQQEGTDVPVGAAADGVCPRIQRVETKGPTVRVVFQGCIPFCSCFYVYLGKTYVIKIYNFSHFSVWSLEGLQVGTVLLQPPNHWPPELFGSAECMSTFIPATPIPTPASSPLSLLCFSVSVKLTALGCSDSNALNHTVLGACFTSIALSGFINITISIRTVVLFVAKYCSTI